MNAPAAKVFFIISVVFIFLILVILRVVQLSYGDYMGSAVTQAYGEMKIPSIRPKVYDRGGNLLLTDIISYSIRVDPKVITEKGYERLCEAITCKKTLSTLVSTGNRYILLASGVPRERASKIGKIYGVITVPSRHRHVSDYAKGWAGKITTDGFAIGGIESYIGNRRKDYTIQTFNTGKRSNIYSSNESDIFKAIDAAYSFNKVYVSVDLPTQSAAQEFLDRRVSEYRARAGASIVIDAKTGEVIAIVTSGGGESEYRWNPLRQMFEPGSIIKPLIYAAALKYGVVEPDTMIDCEKGKMYVGHWPIRDVHPHEFLSAHDVVVKSSNIGAAKMAAMVGADRLIEFFTSLGLGDSIEMEAGKTSEGKIYFDRMKSEIGLATFGFGHGFMLNMAQIVRAYGRILGRRDFTLSFLEGGYSAHGGYFIEKRVRDEVLATLYDVVSRGTAKRLKRADVVIGGKTGTAEKVVDGHYSRKDVVASFVGVSEFNGHRYIAMTSIDEPRKAHYGGTVSAPVVKEIFEYMASGS